MSETRAPYDTGCRVVETWGPSGALAQGIWRLQMAAKTESWAQAVLDRIAELERQAVSVPGWNRDEYNHEANPEEVHR